MYRCCPEMPAIRRMLETGEPGYGFREELIHKRKGRQALLQNLPAASESKRSCFREIKNHRCLSNGDWWGKMDSNHRSH